MIGRKKNKNFLLEAEQGAPCGTALVGGATGAQSGEQILAGFLTMTASDK